MMMMMMMTMTMTMTMRFRRSVSRGRGRSFVKMTWRASARWVVGLGKHPAQQH